MSTKPKKKSVKPAKKVTKRRPATVGLDKIKMFKMPGYSSPVAFRVDKLGRMTRVEIVRDKTDKALLANPFKRLPDSFFKFKVVRSSPKKK